DRASLYWAGRVSLVASRADLDTYDAAFDAWYRSLAPSASELMLELTLPTEHRDAGDVPGGLRVEVARTAGSWRSAAGDEEPETAPPRSPVPGRALRALLPRAPFADPSAGADPRHQRFDGAVFARAAAVRLRRHGGWAARRGLLLRHPAHACHPDAACEGSGPRDARDRQAGRRLGGRHPDRRVPQDAARRVEPARRAPRRGRRALLRRTRAWRPGAAPRPDGAAAPARPPGDLGEPAQGIAEVRAARARDGRRVAERRRVPLGAQPREPRDPGGCPACLNATTAGS